MKRPDYALDRHADPLDTATDLYLMENQNKLDAARLGVRPERVMVDGEWVEQVKQADGSFPHTECVEEDCGDTLPLLRMEMGRIRCVDCQTKKEFNKSRGF
jgi:hypothetical protein